MLKLVYKANLSFAGISRKGSSPFSDIIILIAVITLYKISLSRTSNLPFLGVNI